MRIIGLAGKAGSGKSYLAQKLLVEPAHEGYIPLSLAGPMKAELAAQGVIPGEEAAGREPKSARTRRILQLWGTELGRQRFYEDYWCVRLEWWIAWFLQAGFDRFVIPDVRFPNEAAWIQSLGGLVIRVTGRGGLDGLAAEHESEIALDDFDLPELDNSPDRGMDDVAIDMIDLIGRHYTENPEREPDLDRSDL